MKLKIVFGPPCSGKTTYVKENIEDGDMVVDLDYLKHALTYKEYHDDLEKDDLDYLWDLRNHLIGNPKEKSTTWLISTAEVKENLSMYDEVIIIEMDKTKEEIYEYIDNDESRGDKQKWKDLVDKWFEENEIENSIAKEVKTIKNKKFWEVKNAVEKNIGEIYIYGEITSYKWYEEDTTAKSFKEDLDSLGDIDTLNVCINSPGGSVFQGQAIVSILKRCKATINIHIDGVAASIASVIAMAGTVHMPSNSMMMIHNPWTWTYGNAKDLRKQADDLDKIRESLISMYLDKAGDKLDRDTLIDLLDKESWLTAQECYEYGLCDVLGEEKEIAACLNSEMLSKYKNTPKELLNISKDPKQSVKNIDITKDEEIEILLARVNNTLKFEEELINE